jgi:4a-hydroxytetrahydrobiopterin dehydratase
VAVEQGNPDDDLTAHREHDRDMAERPPVMTADELEAALGELAGWTGDTDGVERTVECASFPAAIDLVGKVGAVAEEMDHHPDMDIRWRKVRFALSTHSAGGVTSLDVALARRIDELAQ